MTDNFDITPEWVIDLTKGGPGSGPRPGHKFRGNRNRNAGTRQAGRHNLTELDNKMKVADHFATAKAHIMAGMNALHSGKFNQAANHFDFAAKHGALASLKGHGMQFQRGSELYKNAHIAGDLARLASRAHGHMNSHTELSPSDQKTLNLLRLTASGTTNLAVNHANTLNGTLASITSEGHDRGGIDYSAAN